MGRVLELDWLYHHFDDQNSVFGSSLSTTERHRLATRKNATDVGFTTISPNVNNNNILVDGASKPFSWRFNWTNATFSSGTIGQFRIQIVNPKRYQVYSDPPNNCTIVSTHSQFTEPIYDSGWQTFPTSTSTKEMTGNFTFNISSWENIDWYVESDTARDEDPDWSYDQNIYSIYCVVDYKRKSDNHEYQAGMFVGDDWNDIYNDPSYYVDQLERGQSGSVGQWVVWNWDSTPHGVKRPLTHYTPMTFNNVFVKNKINIELFGTFNFASTSDLIWHAHTYVN